MGQERNSGIPSTRARSHCSFALAQDDRIWGINAGLKACSTLAQDDSFLIANLCSLKACSTPALTAEGGCATRRSQLLDRDFAQEFEVAEHFAGAEYDAGQGIIGDGDRQAGFFAD